MLVVSGYHSTIIQELLQMVPEDEPFERIAAHEAPPFDADRYVFCAGRLTGKTGMRITDAFEHQSDDTWRVNALHPMRACDEIIRHNENARICVVGSESAYTWSYDGAYAASKAALHRYVETKSLMTPQQQLVCVAPTVISDSGMTERREDKARLEQRRSKHPKRRFLKAREVAQVIHFLLYIDEGYLTNIVIRMNGGEHAQ